MPTREIKADLTYGNYDLQGKLTALPRCL